MNREELAWAAGFFDGEGWVSPGRYSASGGVTAGLVLGVGQAERELLDRFAAAVGLGSVTGPTRSRRDQPTVMWAFKVHGYEKVQAVAALLWPWLGTRKRAQIAEALRDGQRHAAVDIGRRRRLLTSQLDEIWRRHRAGERNYEIARAVGLPKGTISSVVRRRTYRNHVPREVAA